MIVFVCAFYKEATPLIEHFALERSANNLWDNRGKTMRLIVTGKGAAAAQEAVARHGSGGGSFINAGLAGHPTLAIGTPVVAHKVSAGSRAFYPQHIFSPPCITEELQTVSAPDLTYRKETLVDMEAIGFFEAAVRYTPIEHIHVLKVVSDNKKSAFSKAQTEALMRHLLAPLETLCAHMHTLADNRPPASALYTLLLEKFHWTATETHLLKEATEHYLILSSDCATPLAYTNKKALLSYLQRPRRIPL